MFPLVVKNVSIAPPVYRTLVERHYVLCQGACLVREDVLYLAKLLVQRGRPRLRRCVVGQVVHLPVPVYQLRKEQANHLNRMNLEEITN